VGPDLRKHIEDSQFVSKISRLERNAWLSFGEVAKILWVAQN